MALTLQSPGVQINEVDLSQTPVLPTGTNILVAGFAPQGPSDQIVQVNSLNEFEQVYGTPQTPAERYFYQSVAPIFNTSANVNVYRMPYGPANGTGFGTYYGALVYPVIPVCIDNNNQSIYGTEFTTLNAQQSGIMYVLGQPSHFDLTQAQYQAIIQKGTATDGSGFSFNWSNTVNFSPITQLSQIGSSGVIVLNKGQTTIDQTYQGYYVGLIDNSNINPSSNYNDILTVQSVVTANPNQVTVPYITLPSARLAFNLSAVSDNLPYGSIITGNTGPSVSQVLEDASSFNIGTRAWDDTLNLGVFKLNQSSFSPNTIQLAYSLVEKYTGSLDYWRTINNPNGGSPQNFYLATEDNQSSNVVVLVNDYISQINGTPWLDNGGAPTNKIRMVTQSYSSGASLNSLFISASSAFGITSSTSTSAVATLTGTLVSIYNTLLGADSLFPLGSYTNGNLQTKDLGSIPAKVDRLLNIAANTELYNIDVTVDAGMSTIFAVQQYMNNTPSLSSTISVFNDEITIPLNGLYVTDPGSITDPTAKTFIQNYQTIINKYSNFATLVRKDHIFIGDLPRNLFIQGPNSKILDNPSYNFALNVYSPIKAATQSFNTSYMSIYGNWVKVFDNNLNDNVWIPSSGYVAATYANTDANFQPWFAPAGFTRGIVNGIVDIALYPNQKQRDQLYNIAVNPIAFFPNEGYVIYGQKTFLKQPSAFDRVNVRRLFLNLEKATNATAKFFVFEPNTLLTRTRLVNTLKPLFENAKNTEGVYDYLIVCDERNNTPAIIDANELVVDIYLKPVRAAEFILVNFYATPTGTNFSELA